MPIGARFKTPRDLMPSLHPPRTGLFRAIGQAGRRHGVSRDTVSDASNAAGLKCRAPAFTLFANVDVRREPGYSREECAVVIWRFIDGKPGHEKQSRGLLQGIEAIHPIAVFEIDVRMKSFFWRQMFRRLRGETPDLPLPDLLVGAGHRTHLPLLIARIVCGGRTVILMKPTLPHRCFDLVFVPEHDRVRRKANVIETRGVICPAVVADKDRETGLILLGGTSPHFHWSNRDVCRSVAAIAAASPDVHWQVCDSRRTPPDLPDHLPDAANLIFRHWQAMPAGFLEESLPRAGYAWVTADSASMLYESLSAGARVGVIEVAPKSRRNKHVHAIRKLVAEGQVLSTTGGYRLRTSDPPGFVPENQRCAAITVDRLLAGSPRHAALGHFHGASQQPVELNEKSP